MKLINIFKIIIVIVISMLICFILKRCGDALYKNANINIEKYNKNKQSIKWNFYENNEEIITMLFDDVDNWRILPLTQGFCNKYKSISDLCNEIDSSNHHCVSRYYDRIDNKDIYLIDLSFNELDELEQLVQIEYEFIITNEGYIDDYKVLNRYVIHGPSETVVDGPQKIKYLDIYQSVQYYLLEYNTEDFKGYYEPLLLAENCVIINKPKINSTDRVYSSSPITQINKPWTIEILDNNFDDIANFTLNWKLNDNNEFVYIEFINYS